METCDDMRHDVMWCDGICRVWYGCWMYFREGFGWILGVGMGWRWGQIEVSFWEVILVVFCIDFWCCVVSTWHRRRHECIVNCNTKSMFLICCCVVWMICWLIFDWFLVDLGVENLQKIDQQSIKKEIKNEMRFGMDFRWLLERSWSDLGPKLGPKLGPSWDENPKNGGSKTMSKNVL